ncbi:MAG: tRNA dihydrouridine synthase DusB [Candidatus Omnitrophota bacterium]
MLKIGSLNLNSNLILAPMAGITDLPFRMLNRGFGVELGFVEMLNVRSLSHKSKRTLKMLATCPKDRPLGVQLLGCEPGFLLKGMEVIAGHKFDLLDFNAACPVKKVTQRGEGASLLKDPARLNKLLKIVVKESRVPVTVKIRTGWDDGSVDITQLALKCRDAGIAAVFIHGRTKVQGYSGAVDYDAIRRAKRALDIPVIASGDIFSAQLAKKMFEETGCDGVLAARGALGNPWIFSQISNFMEKNLITDKPQKSQLLDTMLKHLEMCVDFHGERIGVMVFRKFFSWYTKGLYGIRPLREKSSRVQSKAVMAELIRQAASNTTEVVSSIAS